LVEKTLKHSDTNENAQPVMKPAILDRANQVSVSIRLQ